MAQTDTIAPVRTIDPTAPAYGQPSNSAGDRQRLLQEAVKGRQSGAPLKPGSDSGSSAS